MKLRLSFQSLWVSDTRVPAKGRCLAIRINAYCVQRKTSSQLSSVRDRRRSFCIISDDLCERVCRRIVDRLV